MCNNYNALKALKSQHLKRFPYMLHAGKIAMNNGLKSCIVNPCTIWGSLLNFNKIWGVVTIFTLSL